MTGARIAVPLGLAVALRDCRARRGAARLRGEIAAGRAGRSGGAGRSRASTRAFDAAVAAREIDAALAANDADLAQSFLDLARDRNAAGRSRAGRQGRGGERRPPPAPRAPLGSFARGLVTGEPDDLVGLAGTALGDLFVFGDIRDAVREGTRLATGQQVDELILGLACVGLAVTAGTYATVGAAAPARVGLSLVKAARKTGRHRQPAWRHGSAARCARSSTGRRSGARVGGASIAAARGGRARRARGGQGREGARTWCGWSATSAACRARPARRRRSTVSSSPRGRATCRGSPRLADAKGRQDPRDPQARAAAAPSCSRSARSISPCGCSGRSSTVFGFVSSLKRMTERDDRALLRAPQAPHRARATVRARTACAALIAAAQPRQEPT